MRVREVLSCREIQMLYDALIIGGSFAGLSAAMQLARARCRILVVDAGRPRNRSAKSSHGFLGQDGQAPQQIQQLAADQVAAYPTVDFFKGEALTAHRTDAGEFVVRLSDGRAETARRLILATGLRDELPPLPGLQERWGASVLHCPYCHGYEVADRQLGVLATMAMSVHQAMLIPDWGPTTYFTQSIFEPTPEEAEGLSARGVRLERTPIVALKGEGLGLAGVELADGRVIPIQALFAGPKVHMASPIAEQLGCRLEEGPMGPYIAVDGAKQTSVPGVFAAGDAASPMHNATLSSAAGVMAGFGVHRSLVFPEHGA
jgi:thioredoxin reductase